MIATANVRKGATLSPCGLYRYSLTRIWDDRVETLAWVMLNPSTADAELDDPTIRRVMGFSAGWGGFEVVNLYAYRTSEPSDLLDALGAGIDVRGPENVAHIERALQRCGAVVFAWGAWWDNLHARRRPPRIAVESLARRVGVRPLCLGLTKAGAPRHPLYALGATRFQDFSDQFDR